MTNFHNIISFKTFDFFTALFINDNFPNTYVQDNKQTRHDNKKNSLYYQKSHILNHTNVDASGKYQR